MRPLHVFACELHGTDTTELARFVARLTGFECIGQQTMLVRELCARKVVDGFLHVRSLVCAALALAGTTCDGSTFTHAAPAGVRQPSFLSKISVNDTVRYMSFYKTTRQLSFYLNRG